MIEASEEDLTAYKKSKSRNGDDKPVSIGRDGDLKPVPIAESYCLKSLRSEVSRSFCHPWKQRWQGNKNDFKT